MDLRINERVLVQVFSQHRENFSNIKPGHFSKVN